MVQQQHGELLTVRSWTVLYSGILSDCLRLIFFTCYASGMCHILSSDMRMGSSHGEHQSYGTSHR